MKQQPNSFLDTFFGKNPNWKRADSLNKSTVAHDKWDSEDYDKLLKGMREFSAAEDELGDAVDTGNSAFADAYFALVKADPKLRRPQDVRPSHLINREVMNQMTHTTEYEELRSYSAGDEIGAALAAISMEPELEVMFDKLKQESKKATELEKQMEALMDMQQEAADIDKMMQDAMEAGDEPEAQNFQDQAAKIQQQMDDLAAQIQQGASDLDQAMKGKSTSIQMQLKAMMKKAADEANENDQSALTWGLDRGTLMKMPPEERMELAKRLNTPKFKKIAELFGPMQRLAFAEQARKTVHARDEVYDLSLGNDLSRVLPIELMGLLHPILKLDFFRKFTEGQLLQYELRGTEKVAKGEIVFCEDGSGSMGGEREIWAKAVGLCLLHIAKSQNRGFYGIHFGSASELMQFDFRDSKNVSVDQVIDFASFFFGGGPLRVDQRVATPNGWKPIGAMEVGDEVFGPDGKPRNVIGVYPQGVLKDMYKVRFKDGAEVICDATHFWTVLDRTVNGVRTDKAAWKTIRLSEMLEQGIEANWNGYRYSVPITEPIEMPEARLPLDPYLLGYLIGDGGFTGTSPIVTCAEGEDMPWVDVLPVGMTYKSHEKREGFCPSYLLKGSTAGRGRNEVTEGLRDLGLWGLGGEDKFIPESYLWASVEQRWSLLQGLCDSDGNVNGVGRAEFSTSSLKLAEGVVQLAQSLGNVAKIIVAPARRENWHEYYRVNIMIQKGGPAPFRLDRKVQIWQDRHHPIVRSIVSAERVEDAEAICIKVGAQDGLFLTEGMVVTHNTNFERPLSTALEIIKEGKAAKGQVNADIVFVTDGECGVSEKWLASFKEEQEVLGFRVYGIVIGGSSQSEPLKTICDGRVISIADILSGSDIREIFRSV